MRTRVLFFSVLLIGFTSLGALSIEEHKFQDHCEQSLLPTPAQQLLEIKFPSWRPLRLADLSEHERNLWLKSGNAKECPGVAIGNFESSRETSYAVLLIPRHQNFGYKLLVLRKTSQGKYHERIVSSHAETGAPVAFRVPPGEYQVWDRSAPPVRTHLDSLVLEWMERSAWLYYYRNGRYHELQVVD